MLEQLREKLTGAAAEVVAIEALWDGDTGGWFIDMYAVLDRPSDQHARYDSLHLCTLSEGGDIRVFAGAVPPWPEARTATALGEALAPELGVPFYFPSPKVPDDQCARWWDRGHAHRCSGCGVALRAGYGGRPWPWPGACSGCVSDLESSGGVGVNVRVTHASCRDVESFESQRDAWVAVIVSAEVGLVKLVNAISDNELWIMLVVNDRESGLEAVLAYLREAALLDRAVVSVDGRGKSIRVWPTE